MTCGIGEGTTHHFACDCREEMFRRLAEAAKHTAKGLAATISNYNTIITGKPNCVIDDDDLYGWKGDLEMIEEALKFYATPGHSPEGKEA